MPSIVLNSNSGEHALEFKPKGRMDLDGERGIVASLHLKGRTWDGDHDHGLSISLESVSLAEVALRRMSDALTEWLDLPLNVLAETSLVGAHSLCLARDQSLDISFGDTSDIIADRNQVVAVALKAGRLEAKYFFVTDQSCIRAFQHGLATALRRGAG